MIPKPYIAKWKNNVPWKTNEQVEQDLVISRALIHLFNDDFLKENLAFRGGTALHKLYLNPAPRYSEDIDLVQIKEGPIKPILERINEVITFFEEKRIVKQKLNNNTILNRFTSEYSQTRLRLKMEMTEAIQKAADDFSRKELNVPVLDGVVCALIIATGLVRYNVSISKIRRYNPEI